MDSLPEGRYALEWFKDVNGDGIWNPGDLSPWLPQEPFARRADTLTVLPGAVNDGGAPLAWP